MKIKNYKKKNKNSKKNHKKNNKQIYVPKFNLITTKIKLLEIYNFFSHKTGRVATSRRWVILANKINQHKLCLRPARCDSFEPYLVYALDRSV